MAGEESTLGAMGQGAAAGSAAGPWGAVIGAGVGLLGSLMGRQGASEEQRRAEAARLAALQAYQNIKVPTAEEMMANYQAYSSVGDYSPEALAQMQLGDTAYQSIATDPALKAAQDAALAGLQERSETGLTLSEQAQLQQIQKQAGAQEQARQASILQEMAQRGMGGSGNELAARLMSSQAAADRQSTQDLEVAAQAQERALQALQQAGTMGGNMRTQEFGEQEAVARAKDLFKQQQFEHSTDIARANVLARNEAQLKNLAKNQEIANAQADIRNKQMDQNLGTKQTQFSNQMDRAAGMAGQYRGISAAHDANAQGVAQSSNQMATGVGGLVNAGINAFSKAQPTTADVVKKLGSGSFNPNQA